MKKYGRRKIIKYLQKQIKRARVWNEYILVYWRMAEEIVELLEG